MKEKEENPFAPGTKISKIVAISMFSILFLAIFASIIKKRK